jgi:hypothetical protein
MIKQLFFSSILMLSLCTSATAQDLHVYYDVFLDSVWFKKDGVSTETPGVRKRDQVHLHVVEFNNYLYNIKTEQKEVTDESGKIDLLNSFLPESGSGVDGFLKNLPLGKLGAGFSGMTLTDMLGYISGEKDGASRGDLDLTFKSASEYIERLTVTTEEMHSLSVQISNLSQRISAGTLSVEYIDNLLKSYDLPPSEIKVMAMEHVELMFGSDFVEHPTLEGALSWVNNIQEFREKSARLNQLKDKWDRDKPEFDKTVRKLSLLASEMNEEERKALSDLQNKRDEANLRDLQISSFTDSLGRVEEMAASVTTDKLGALYRKTREVKNHRFEHNEMFKPVGREMDLVLNVTVKNDKKNSDTDPEVYRTRTVRVTNYEGFKYTITPGFCVAGFFTPQKRYSIALNNDNETIIAETDADKFAPLVTTAVQVYNDRGKRVTPGALLGLAVPLTQNGGQPQSLNFVLGPSLVIGRDQRISISLGLMGGKTTRLSQGVTPFQPFDTQNGVRPIPTIDRYEFGWYFGVTGNL